MPPARQTIAGSRYFHETSAERPFSRTVDPECQIFQRYHAGGTVSKNLSQDPQNIIQKSDPLFPAERNAAEKHFHPLAEQPAQEGFLFFSGCCGIRIYKGCRSGRQYPLPLCLMSGGSHGARCHGSSASLCSVSSRISRRSKERTSFTPFTVHVRLLVMVTLCIRPVSA